MENVLVKIRSCWRSFWENIREWISVTILKEPACDPINWTIYSQLLFQALYVVAELKIADLLQYRPMTVAELARKTKVDEQFLDRIMRALAGFKIFAKNNENKYEMTERALPLSSLVPGPIRDWLLFAGSEPKLHANAKLIECAREGKSGFEMAYDMHLWELTDKNQEFGETFRAGMDGWSRWQGKELVKAFDFSRFGKIIDLGGGRGALLQEVLIASPNSKGILFDCKEAIETGKENYSKAGIATRCEFQSGNFFENVPTGADLYMIKHVLHDWEDESVKRILKNCITAMPEESTLILIEGIIDSSCGKDRLQKLLDIDQMVFSNGKKRTKSEWNNLISECGFKLENTHHTSIVDTSVLELKKLTLN